MGPYTHKPKASAKIKIRINSLCSFGDFSVARVELVLTRIATSSHRWTLRGSYSVSFLKICSRSFQRRSRTSFTLATKKSPKQQQSKLQKQREFLYNGCTSFRPPFAGRVFSSSTLE